MLVAKVVSKVDSRSDWLVLPLVTITFRLEYCAETELIIVKRTEAKTIKFRMTKSRYNYFTLLLIKFVTEYLSLKTFTSFILNFKISRRSPSR